MSEIAHAIQELEDANSGDDPALKVVTQNLRDALARHGIAETPGNKPPADASDSIIHNPSAFQPEAEAHAASFSISNAVSLVPATVPYLQGGAPPPLEPSSPAKSVVSEVISAIQDIEASILGGDIELELLLNLVSERLGGTFLKPCASVTEATQTSRAASSILEPGVPSPDALGSSSQGASCPWVEACARSAIQQLPVPGPGGTQQVTEGGQDQGR
jgi:hypothetical protein